MGSKVVCINLLRVIEVVEVIGCKVVWSCDFMYGNIFEMNNGYKMWLFVDMCDEVNGFFDVYEELGIWFGGVYIELIGDDVMECLGGVDKLVEFDLINCYEIVCDLCLNWNQFLELVFIIVERLVDGCIKCDVVSLLVRFCSIDL